VWCRSAVSFVIAGAVGVLSGAQAQAQATVPPRGEGSVAVVYQNVDFRGHINFLGQRVPNGAAHSQTVLFEAEYGLTDNLAIGVGLPYVTAKYTGQGPACPLCASSPLGFHAGPNDDGLYHGGVQDFRIDLRQNIFRRPLILTPSIGVVIPSHHYEQHGEAAIGRGLRELQIAVNLARSLEPFLPDAYVQGLYAYTFVQRDLNIPLNKSNAFVEAGYSFTSSLAVRGLATWQKTHGGLNGFPEFEFSEELLQNHDRLLRDNNWRAGAGLVYSLTESVDLSATVITVVAGTVTHFGTGITLGTIWSFAAR
jgi:hypothetical protein